MKHGRDCEALPLVLLVIAFALLVFVVTVALGWSFAYCMLADPDSSRYLDICSSREI